MILWTFPLTFFLVSNQVKNAGSSYMNSRDPGHDLWTKTKRKLVIILFLRIRGRWNATPYLVDWSRRVVKMNCNVTVKKYKINYSILGLLGYLTRYFRDQLYVSPTWTRITENVSKNSRYCSMPYTHFYDQLPSSPTRTRISDIASNNGR